MPSSRYVAAAVVFAAMTLAAVNAPAGADEPAKAGISIVTPWARATPGGATTGVAYLEIAAAPGVADRLIGVSSPAAGRAELHTHVMHGDVMTMRRIDAVVLKPGGSVTLAPRGDHIMLLDLKAPLHEGDKLPLTLVFEKAGVMDATAIVAAIGASGPTAAPP